jgi:hypothetical protein
MLHGTCISGCTAIHFKFIEAKGASMKRISMLMAVLCISTAALAQKADVAFTIGGSFVSDTQQLVFLPPALGSSNTAALHTDHHYFLEGTLGARMLNAHLASLHLEVPVAGIPSQRVSFSDTASTFVSHISTVFVTPSLRLKLAPVAPISPWVSVGGGWARYAADSGNNSNKAALQFGGGLDFKTGLPLLGFRAEVRDFVTGDPDLNIVQLANSSGLHHHNILAGGGIVLRF